MSLPARLESIQYPGIVVSPTFTGFGENATAFQRHRLSREQGIDFPMTPLCCPLRFMDSEQIQPQASGGILFDNFQTSQPDAANIPSAISTGQKIASATAAIPVSRSRF